MEHIEGAALERRVNELEKEYEAEARKRADTQRIDELRFQFAGLIGKNNLQMLTEYTDRLIAQYNADVDWFYRKGLEDARRVGLLRCEIREGDDRGALCDGKFLIFAVDGLTVSCGFFSGSSQPELRDHLKQLLCLAGELFA